MPTNMPPRQRKLSILIEFFVFFTVWTFAEAGVGGAALQTYHLGGAFGQSDDPSVAPGAANCDTSTLPTAWSNTLRSEVRPMALPLANHSANSGESIHLRMTGYER